MSPVPLPSQFILPNVTAITGPVFELKHNPNEKAANKAALAWFRKYNCFPEAKLNKFLDVGKYGLFAAISFPESDAKHLETCLEFILWAVASDDVTDEGELMDKFEEIQVGIDLSLKAVRDLNADVRSPDFPYAAMLQDILKRMRQTATDSAYYRFTNAFEVWTKSQIEQSKNRATDRMPSIEEFINMRRTTIGTAMVKAMVEYSLDLDVPDSVMEHPLVVALWTATNDIITWPNDLCSFNKEQAEGDYQNLIICVMIEKNMDLQGAVNYITDMVRERVHQYVELKNQLPSFGPDIDRELRRYVKALEHFVQGSLEWYYQSPRYFRNIDTSKRDDLLIPLFDREPLGIVSKPTPPLARRWSPVSALFAGAFCAGVVYVLST